MEGGGWCLFRVVLGRWRIGFMLSENVSRLIGQRIRAKAFFIFFYSLSKKLPTLHVDGKLPRFEYAAGLTCSDYCCSSAEWHVWV